MPNRCQSKQYELMIPFLMERDGGYCLACFIEHGQRRGIGSVKLEIDHADGDRHNWAPSNLHLLCKTHNIKFRSLSPREHITRMAAYSAENESKRIRLNLYEPELRRAGIYAIGSPEMQVNSRALRKWKTFMHEWIDANGSITKEVAINAGAVEADDVDIQTTGRYWKKHTSISGRFKEVVIDNVVCAVYREPKTYRKDNGQRES